MELSKVFCFPADVHVCIYIYIQMGCWRRCQANAVDRSIDPSIHLSSQLFPPPPSPPGMYSQVSGLHVLPMLTTPSPSLSKLVRSLRSIIGKAMRTPPPHASRFLKIGNDSNQPGVPVLPSSPFPPVVNRSLHGPLGIDRILGHPDF